MFSTLLYLIVLHSDDRNERFVSSCYTLHLLYLCYTNKSYLIDVDALYYSCTVIGPPLPSRLTSTLFCFCCFFAFFLQRNLTEYFVAVDVNNMLHLYASMLYERRILICCSKLSTVSTVDSSFPPPLPPFSRLISISPCISTY